MSKQIRMVKIQIFQTKLLKLEFWVCLGLVRKERFAQHSNFEFISFVRMGSDPISLIVLIFDKGRLPTLHRYW